MSTTLVSWNLKGSGNPDTVAVAEYLREVGADVVGLQEVQWHQARRIARALGARSWGWGFKHWPVRTWPEGMAVIGVTRRVHVRTRALSYRWRPWSWRRRIVQTASVDPTIFGPGGPGGPGGPTGPAGSGGPRERGEATDDGGTELPGDDGFTLVNVHLTPHGQIDLRGVETTTVLRTVAQRLGPVVVSGDFNERPGGPIHQQLATAGLRDGWGESRGGEASDGGKRAPDPSPTNWRGWRRGTTKSPTQRLDYVYVSPAVGLRRVEVPEEGTVDLARFAALSDHLPVTAVLDLRAGTGADS